ncbi:hypothetical protein ACF0H5_022897 [Mactra antiquata]
MDSKYIVFYLISVLIFSVTEATDCPDLWIPYSGSCYRFGHQALTFFEAEHYCQQHNARLVHIESADENNFLKQEMSQLIADRWWIGLSDDDIEGKFVWYGTTSKPEFTDWSAGNPSDSLHNEDCVELIRYQNKEMHWNDIDCHTTRAAICEKTGNLPAVVG